MWSSAGKQRVRNEVTNAGGREHGWVGSCAICDMRAEVNWAVAACWS
jgi:hypothetical protein